MFVLSQRMANLGCPASRLSGWRGCSDNLDTGQRCHQGGGVPRRRHDVVRQQQRLGHDGLRRWHVGVPRHQGVSLRLSLLS